MYVDKHIYTYLLPHPKPIYDYAGAHTAQIALLVSEAFESYKLEVQELSHKDSQVTAQGLEFGRSLQKVVVPLEKIEYGFAYTIVRSSYTPT